MPHPTGTYEEFTSSGTYTKPPWATVLIVETIGGGAGGGGGEGRAAGNQRLGGSAGGAAARVRYVFNAADV